MKEKDFGKIIAAGISWLFFCKYAWLCEHAEKMGELWDFIDVHFGRMISKFMVTFDKIF